MSEQPELALDPPFPARVVLDQVEILQFARERVAGERYCFGERLSIAPNSAAREIERYRVDTFLCERAREIGEERPVRETLESVTNDDRAFWRFCLIDFAADGETILTRKVERFRSYRLRRCQSSISPSMSAQP